jgi:hypothetical protein
MLGLARSSIRTLPIPRPGTIVEHSQIAEVADFPTSPGNRWGDKGMSRRRRSGELIRGNCGPEDGANAARLLSVGTGLSPRQGRCRLGSPVIPAPLASRADAGRGGSAMVGLAVWRAPLCG